MNGFGRGEDKEKDKKFSLITRETVGMTLLLFSAIVFLITVTGPYLFGEVGTAITAFFLGILGYAVYPVLVMAALLSLGLVLGKKIFSGRWLLRGGLLFAFVFFIVHTATAPYRGMGYGEYLSACWSAASAGAAGSTGGGVVFGVIDYPVCALITDVGAYVLFALCTAAALYSVLLLTPLAKYIAFKGMRDRPAPAGDKGSAKGAPPRTEGARPYPGAVTFEELPEPARASADARYAAEPAPAPSRGRAAADDAAVRSRALLFGADPAVSYRTNLIYDKDSYFNSPGRGAAAAPPAGGYSAQYAAQAEGERPATPRKVTEEKPRAESGYTYPVREDYDANYAQTPSYRAPGAPQEPARRDYYAHDVEPGDFSSAPNVYDEPPAASAGPARAPDGPLTYRAPSEDAPASPFSRSSFGPTEGASSAPSAPPSRFAQDPPRREEAPPAAERGAEGGAVPPSRFAQSEGSAAAEPPAADRDSEFRSLFSRSFEERTRIERPLPFDGASRGESARAPQNDAFSRGGEEETAVRDLRDERFERGGEEKPVSRGREDGLFARGENEAAAAPASDDGPDPESRVFDSDMRGGMADLFDDDEFEDGGDYREEPPAVSRGRINREPARGEGSAASSRLSAARGESAPVPAAPVRDIQPPAKHVYRDYIRPSIENFTEYNDTVNISQEEIETNTAIIVDTLAGFKVDAEVVKVTIGPAVTRYDIDIPRNIAVSTVVKRDKEIALRLHARDGVNMYANNSSGAISIEVPNAQRATVGIKSVLQAEEYINAKEGSLMFVIGKDVENKSICGNIVKMKHLLVAGATGSGKSVCLNAMLISLICKYSPEDLRLILIDPKKVEFAVFDGLPHLMINEIIAEPQKAVTALNWAIKEMERRYLLFEQKTREQHLTVRNVDEYNAVRTEDEMKLPKIVIIVDELADLMSVAKKDIEERIQRLAQKARAAGIHLVIATQRPSVDIITGVIKGNLPTRLAFRVIQEVDSRTILDESGAEKLLGNGDMLYRTEGMFNCMRVQGAFLSSGEVQAIVDDIKANNEAYFDESVASYINTPGTSSGEGGGGDEGDGSVDPEFIRALGIVVKLGQASISLIQRKCSVGYNHAGKIIEWMEAMGYISPFDGKAKAREVIMTQEEFEAKYGSIN